MAWKIVSYRPSNVKESGLPIIVAILDADADLESVGTKHGCGSIAMVAKKGGKVYMLNASGRWEEI